MLQLTNMSKLTFEMRENEQLLGLVYLCYLVKQKLKDSLNIVEVGCYCGSGTRVIANTFNGSTINCVDPWEKYVEDCSVYDMDKQELELKEAESIFDKVISKYNNVIKNKMTSSDYVSKIEDKSVDFVYIDGNHQYSSVKEDITNWLPKIKTGGVLCGHDFGWASVSTAIKEVLVREPDAVFMDGSWLYFV